MPSPKSIPIIDLFAGPGGLGEGFSRLNDARGLPVFSIRLSIEKDFFAHKTLQLRAFFRQFPKGEAPDDYYAYLRGEISREILFTNHPKEAKAASHEAQMLTLGENPEISDLIGERLDGAKDWVLIGGPPCQAYSLVGRSRMLGTGSLLEGETEDQFRSRRMVKQEAFAKDHRHHLYREYLKIIADHRPGIFVMENVKGILSAKVDGELIFPKILQDLRDPMRALVKEGPGLRYKIFSLVKPADGLGEYSPMDYLIPAEEYGVPQARHRVILLGIRDDLADAEPPVLRASPSSNVRRAIGSLPKLTPGLSRKVEGQTPYLALMQMLSASWWSDFQADPRHSDLAALMKTNLSGALRKEKRGRKFHPSSPKSESWYEDPKLGGLCNHETRTHIAEDLWRYFFCSCFAELHRRSPHLRDFPQHLLPNHRNVGEAIAGKKFGDRFRVQIFDRPSSTVTSHISKDGHYFIHPDPTQYRSLTVREAARLQTFPDNYFFEGPRTQQFHQVGNAVPPKLAFQIGQIVYDYLMDRKSKGR